MSLPHKPHAHWKAAGIRSRSSSGTQSHPLSWCLLFSFPFLGHLSLPTGSLSTPARTSPRGQNYSGPFSCRMHCQLTQSLEFQHSSHYERSTSEPHQLANTGPLELAVLRTRLQPTQLTCSQDVLGGSEVKNPPSNPGDVGSILGWGTKITYGGKELSPCTSVIEPAYQN